MITRLIWTIWTSLSSVPRKAVKFNHSLTHWCFTFPLCWFNPFWFSHGYFSEKSSDWFNYNRDLQWSTLVNVFNCTASSIALNQYIIYVNHVNHDRSAVGWAINNGVLAIFVPRTHDYNAPRTNSGDPFHATKAPNCIIGAFKGTVGNVGVFLLIYF